MNIWQRIEVSDSNSKIELGRWNSSSDPSLVEVRAGTKWKFE